MATATIFLMITTKDNKPFSQIKDNNPKMYNALKAKCEKYNEMFKSEFKVKRCMFTRNGLKFI